MDAEKMTITLDTEDMRTVLASVGFVVCDWKEKPVMKSPARWRMNPPCGMLKCGKRFTRTFSSR